MKQPLTSAVPVTSSLMTRLLAVLSLLVATGFVGLALVQSNLTHANSREVAAQTFEDKTVLVASQMLGGIKWHKEASIERAYASLIDETGVRDLVGVRVVSADGTVLDTYVAPGASNRDLEAAMAAHPADARSASSSTLDGEYLTVVTIRDPRRDTVLGHVGLAWSGARVEAAFGAIRTKALLLSLALSAGILGIMVLSLRSMALKPIRGLQRAMSALADGDTNIAVPCTGRSDEIGRMAQTVEVFREGAIRIEHLHQEKIEAERRAAADREAERDREEQRRLAEEQKARAEEERRRAAAEEDAARKAAEAAAKEEDAKAQAVVVERLAEGLKKIAEGDLSFRIKDRFTRDYESLRVDFNAALEGLETSMTTVIDSARMIEDAVSEIQQGANELSKRTESQAATIEETAAALDEVTTAVSQTASGAQTADATASRARDVAVSSNGVVKEAVDAMSRIETSSREVSKILNVIDEIAFQTNLLALNAGVEAARAGEAGRGFAVVASEVRALAQRSSEAAKEIKNLIGGSTKEVEAGVQLVHRAGTSIDEILVSVKEVSELVASISASASEQSRGLSEINLAVNRMDTVTQQNAAMVEESTATSHALGQKARELMGNISRFRTSAKTARPAPSVPRPAAPAASAPAATPQAPARPAPAPAAKTATAAPAPKAPAEKPAARPKPATGDVKSQQARISAFAETNLAIADDDEDWAEF